MCGGGGDAAKQFNNGPAPSAEFRAKHNCRLFSRQSTNVHAHTQWMHSVVQRVHSTTRPTNSDETPCTPCAYSRTRLEQTANGGGGGGGANEFTPKVAECTQNSVTTLNTRDGGGRTTDGVDGGQAVNTFNLDFYGEI